MSAEMANMSTKFAETNFRRWCMAPHTHTHTTYQRKVRMFAMWLICAKSPMTWTKNERRKKRIGGNRALKKKIIGICLCHRRCRHHRHCHRFYRHPFFFLFGIVLDIKTGIAQVEIKQKCSLACWFVRTLFSIYFYFCSWKYEFGLNSLCILRTERNVLRKHIEHWTVIEIVLQYSCIGWMRYT